MMKNRKKYDMCKILLLEDDISLIDGLEFSLQKNDFTVETVRTVGEALKRLQNDDLISQYDLLLLDITLPDGTGFEVCERVRKENSRIPVIFLTASDEEVNVIRGLDGGGTTISPNRSNSANSAPGSARCSGAPDTAGRQGTMPRRKARRAAPPGRILTTALSQAVS